MKGKENIANIIEMENKHRTNILQNELQDLYHIEKSKLNIALAT